MNDQNFDIFYGKFEERVGLCIIDDITVFQKGKEAIWQGEINEENYRRKKVDKKSRWKIHREDSTFDIYKFLNREFELYNRFNIVFHD